MGVSNFDAIAANSMTVAGLVPATFVGKGTTPAAGWTSGTGHSFKDITVTGAAVGDVVLATIDVTPLAGTPAVIEMVMGRVTGANTLRLYYFTLSSGGGGTAGATTITGAVGYVVIRPS